MRFLKVLETTCAYITICQCLRLMWLSEMETLLIGQKIRRKTFIQNSVLQLVMRVNVIQPVKGSCINCWMYK